MKLNKPKFWDEKIGFLSILLLPITFISLIIILLKKKLSKTKFFKIPIICVGNIYLGGTGKTPTSIFLANELVKLGKKPTIFRKLYKSHVDEYELIRNKFDNLNLNKNRVKGLREIESSNFDIAILDDGFQDYSINKDLNIICFHSNQLAGNGLILPSGPLRDSLNTLKKADMVLINGAENNSFEKKILKINKNLKIFYSYYKPINIENFKGTKLLALAGIANPENFFQLLQDNGLKIDKKLIFPDHYMFSKNEIINIKNIAKDNNYKIIMTEKDYCKIKKFDTTNLEYLEVSLEIRDKEKFLTNIKDFYENY
tara:strand:+ start:3888 stop:4826 length:939 start_codon:yes stop_codon:yes gene_type:complete